MVRWLGAPHRNSVPDRDTDLDNGVKVGTTLTALQ